MNAQNFRYASLLTLKWLAVPVALGLLLVLLVSVGAVSAATDNWLVGLIGSIAALEMSVSLTYWRLGALLYLLAAASLVVAATVSRFAIRGMAFVLFSLSMFPLIYLIAMLFKVSFVEPSSHAAMASMGYLLGFVLLLLS